MLLGIGEAVSQRSARWRSGVGGSEVRRPHPSHPCRMLPSQASWMVSSSCIFMIMSRPGQSAAGTPSQEPAAC
ncbi:hypothetical protein HaLaN_01431 [Haematococcus lacustris]|uniref:Uncharacterized protein n=1 Tax=Haematococcus lacustris TaxID=44745 RepID=A0A699Y982_HAELA|nr:hypothetical protein HaLaN_01431 [Haematococcus lacustris]